MILISFFQILVQTSRNAILFCLLGFYISHVCPF